MKIIDREKDHYDYLSNYYGVDDRLVYYREKKIIDNPGYVEIRESIINKIVCLNSYEDFRLHRGIYARNLMHDMRNRPKNADLMSYYWLVICGLHIPILTTKPDDRTSFDPDYFSGKNVNISEVKPIDVKWTINSWSRVFVNHFTDDDMGLALAINEPVFVFRADYNRLKKFGLCNIHIPKLKHIKGLDQYISQEQIYQNIEMFIGRQRDNMKIPDTPNDIKILQAGFDLKKSFRKR